MRILYLHQYFNLPSDPGGTRSYEMARRLVKYGHEVFMITSDRRGKFQTKGWQVTKETGIEVHWLPVPYDNRMSYGQRIKAFVTFAIASARRAAAIPADVVFATSTPLTIAIPGIYASQKQKIPMVFEVRDLWPELPIAMGALKGPLIPLARWLERFAYNNSSRIVALSSGMRDGVRRTGYPLSNIHIIPNSSDLELFSLPKEAGELFRNANSWLKNNPLVIYAGTLGKINGVSYLAYLAAEVRKLAPEIRFLVVGGGAEEKIVRDTAADLGVLNETFFMLPSIPKREMPNILAAANIASSVFINLPEMWANSANKFFDALAAGTPVAINYAGWQADLLKETGAGLVLPYDDLPTAARMLTEFIHDEERLEQAGKAARKLAETKFNRDILAKQLETVLLEAVKDFENR